MQQEHTYGDDARLASLLACEVLDTPRELAFDSIVFTAAQLFRVPMAMLSLIADKRVWVKAAVGPLQREWDPNHVFCTTLLRLDHLLVIEDASTDARFALLPAVTSTPHIRFCASAPIHGPGRHVIGSLCVLDRQPRSVPERQREQLLQLAHEAEDLLRRRVPDQHYAS